jgi:hypothetical protein
MAKNNKLRNLSSKQMIEEFLDRWEYEWDEVENFDTAERRAIKKCLFEKVIERFEESSEVSFNGTELEEAIDEAKEVSPSGFYSRPNYKLKLGLDEQCLHYINFYIENHNFDSDFSNQEFDLLWGKLYVYVNRRYIDKQYTCLSITKQELNQALDAVSKKRHADSVRAAMDKRDESIRRKRKDSGTLGYNFHSLSDE